ncbi:unnamed protein product [Mytilus coruscus]|uniref:Uncharacterized protein n=1 Tax=Mytilus coruscus TaxID=42192 RepID=A0A6J8CB99_MYTCO|nr:unnamed protein product [Mytilus coruscus]
MYVNKKDDNVVFWICVQCRILPKVVKDIQSQLSSVIQNNVDLVKDIAAKTVQIQSLQAENSRLRELVNKAKPPSTSSYCSTCNSDSDSDDDDSVCDISGRSDNNRSKRASVQSTQKPKPSSTLLMGSSIIRSITQDRFVLDIEPKCVRGGKRMSNKRKPFNGRQADRHSNKNPYQNSYNASSNKKRLNSRNPGRQNNRNHMDRRQDKQYHSLDNRSFSLYDDYKWSDGHSQTPNNYRKSKDNHDDIFC